MADSSYDTDPLKQSKRTLHTLITTTEKELDQVQQELATAEEQGNLEDYLTHRKKREQPDTA